MRLAPGAMALLATLVLMPSQAVAQDCVGPAPDAEPGSAAWERREAENAACGEQRAADLAANPVYQAALAEQASAPRPGRFGDPLRAPERHAGVRFRYEELSLVGHDDAVRPAAIFRPCDASCTGKPAQLGSFGPPYPAVVIVHGGAAQQEMYWWASEMLAEAGYMVLTFQLPQTANSHTEDLRRALDFLFSTSERPTAAGESFPHANELDRAHVGVAGHSAGGVAVSRVGQEDPRVSAIVSWDRAQSTELPADLKLRTPALYVVADFNCQRVPVCVPTRYGSRQDPKGPGTKDLDYQRTAAAGVDTMKIALRAATHLDFSVLPSGVGSRYGQAVASWYTLAWFDRYLKDDADGRRRLVAATFDATSDKHALSGGTYDAATGANVPALLAGLPVRDRLSFHWRSAWSFDRGTVVCEHIRAGGCDGSARPAAARSPCRSRRVIIVRLPRGGAIRRVTMQIGRARPRRVRLLPRRRVRVDLRGRPPGTVRVVIDVTRRSGERIRVVRRYRTCRPRPSASVTGMAASD